MRKFSGNGNWLRRGCPALAILLVTAVVSPLGMQADQKKKKGDAKAETEAKIKAIDYSNIVWPNPPASTAMEYVPVVDTAVKLNRPTSLVTVSCLTPVEVFVSVTLACATNAPC